MPVFIDTPGQPVAAAAGTIEIGLLNNYSDLGLESGERQLVDVLEAAAGDLSVRLRLFALPTVTRGTQGQARIDALYHGFDALTASRLDGLFVTGCEPRTDRLDRETFWPQFSELVDWAQTNTGSTIWSCLAAHGAVLRLDGVERRRLPEKCTGVFAVSRVADHPLVDAGPALHVCHSRWNDVSERDLAGAGYEIITRGAIGVDCFVKRCRSQFVFLQGHPEYDAGALGREYRRDALGFLDSSAATYPTLPFDYFSADEEVALLAFEAEARRAREPATFVRFPLAGRPDERGWRRAFAANLFRNWLQGLHAQAAEVV